MNLFRVDGEIQSVYCHPTSVRFCKDSESESRTIQKPVSSTLIEFRAGKGELYFFLAHTLAEA